MQVLEFQLQHSLNSLRVEENTELLPSGATRDVGGEAVKDLKMLH